MTASTAARMAGSAAAPVGDLILKPLSVQGLWEAVIIDRAGGTALDDLVGGHLRGDGAGGEEHRDVVGEQHLGRGGREVLAGEAAVVADHDALGHAALADDPLGHALGTAAHVVEGVVLADPGAPAVGPEDDGLGRQALVRTRIDSLLARRPREGGAGRARWYRAHR